MLCCFQHNRHKKKQLLVIHNSCNIFGLFQAPVYIAMPLLQNVLEECCCSLGIKGPIQVQNAGLAVQLFRAWETWKGKVSQFQSDIQRIGPAMFMGELSAVRISRGLFVWFLFCLLYQFFFSPPFVHY